MANANAKHADIPEFLLRAAITTPEQRDRREDAARMLRTLELLIAGGGDYLELDPQGRYGLSQLLGLIGERMQ